RNLNFVTPRGRNFAASCRLLLVRNASNWPKYLIVEVMETREKRDTTAQLQRTQKMEAMGQLTGSLASDFNSVLATIINNLGAIQDKGALDDVSAHRLQDGLDAAKRGSELSRQLLAVARRQELAPQDVNINSLVKNMTPLLTRSLGQGIALQIETMPGEPVAVI